jgi:hypothetical protein
MKSIKTIAKLHKKRIDDLKSEIAEVRKLVIELENKRNNFIESFNNQAEFINKNPNFAFDCKPYFDSINIEVTKISYAINNHNQIIDRLNNELIIAFTEAKKIEIFIKNKNILEHQKQAKKESAMMNEIALNNFIKS